MVGFSAKMRKTGGDSANGNFLPESIDILCRVPTGGTTVTGAQAGSDWVEIDWANYVDGDLIPVKPSVVYAAADNNPVIGCAHWGAGAVAAGGTVLVRVWGRHPYAKVDNASYTVGVALTKGAAAGKAKVASGTSVEAGQFVGVPTATSSGAVDAHTVFISNPGNLPLS